MSEIERANLHSLEKAKKTVLQTMELGDLEDLTNFSEKLSLAIQGLPQYKTLEEKMAEVKESDLALEMFRFVREANDVEVEDLENIPTDGVLLSSIRQGHIECAGRTFIASTYLQSRGFPHVVVEAPSHSMLVLEVSQDTLAYCDANHNLFFTFPKSALKGYGGVGVVSECELEEFIPRSTDVVEGFDLPYSQFICVPAQEGVGRQYLGSVKACLAGLPEFENTGIEKDEFAAEMVDQIEQEIFGEPDERLVNFYESDGEAVEQRDNLNKKIQGKVRSIFFESNSADDFFSKFVAFIKSEEGRYFPYLKNASDQVLKSYSDQIFEHFS